MSLQSDTAIVVTDVAEKSRFEITVDGTLAGFADYTTLPGRLVITHSEIDDAYQGRGLAGMLTKAALDSIRDRGLQVTPRCPYTAAYIRKHPDYLDLVDEKHRASVS